MAGQPPSPPPSPKASPEPSPAAASTQPQEPGGWTASAKGSGKGRGKMQPLNSSQGGCGPRNSGKSCEPSMKAWPQSAHGRPFKLVGRKLVSTWCNSSYTGRHGTLGRCTRNRVWCIIVKNTYKPIISHICSRVRLSVVAG